MAYLVLGLLVFLGVHSVRIFAEDRRTRMREKYGAQSWRTAYSLVSVIGFFLIVWGFGLVRQTPIQLWSPPMGMRHLAALLTLPAFVLLAAAYVPGNKIAAQVRHPMMAAITLWALGHLLANGNAGQVLLFGAFLIWSMVAYVAARRRDKGAHQAKFQHKNGTTGITVAIGVAAWLGFTLWLHGLLIGVRPFG